jgi:hypothetical protein
MNQIIGSGLRVGGAAAVAALAALSCAATSAEAQPVSSNQQTQQQSQQAQPSLLARGLFNDPRAQRAARYSTPDGAVRFVFDRSGSRAALVRFEGDPEVHVLRPVAAAGGDEIYRTENGDIALRLSRTGSFTVYTRNNRLGAPAAEEGQVAPLAPEEIARAVFEARLRELQMRAARSVGSPVVFEAPVPTNGYNAGIMLDAAERAAQGLADAPLTIVRRVVITVGATPGAELRGESLTIRVAPEMGFAGRPSSNTVRNVATGQVQGPTQ